MRTQQRQPPFGPHSPHSRISQSLTTTREGPPRALPRRQPAGSKPEKSPERMAAGARGAGRGFLWKRNCPLGGSSPAEQGPGHSRRRPSNLLPTTLLQHQSQEGVLGRPWSREGGSNSKWSWWLSPEGASGETVRAGHSPPGAVGLPVGWGPTLLQLRAQVKAGGGVPLGLCPESKTQLKPPDCQTRSLVAHPRLCPSSGHQLP